MLPCDSSPTDEIRRMEEDAVDRFLSEGCHCTLQCHTKFTRDTLLQAHMDCQAMDYYDSDHINHFHVLLMGSLNSNVCHSSFTGKESKHKPTERVLSRFQPMFRGVSVCMCMFLFGFHCSLKVFKSAKKQFRENGLIRKFMAMYTLQPEAGGLMWTLFVASRLSF